MAKAAESGGTIVSKVTIKSLGCDPKEAVRQNKPVPLARFWGIADAIKYVPNRQTGDTNIAILGTFKGLNLTTGEIFSSGQMYLPSGIHDQISAPLIKAKDTGAASPEIRFAVEVSAKPSNNPVGYEYTGKALMKPEAGDRLSDLEDNIDADLLALPAPAKK